MEKSSVPPYSLSSLLCQEDGAGLTEMLDEVDEEEKYVYLNPCFVSENEDEYMEMLVQRETNFGLKSPVSSVDCPIFSKSWLKHARLDSIQWILNARALLGFHFSTAYLSVTYFDRFLSRRFIDKGKSWAIPLLSVACLSLAAKMEECRVPLFSEYPIEEYEFENNGIQRMELLILHTLEWNMASITPFSYLHYFINKLCSEYKDKEVVSRAVELVLAVTKEINLMDYRPSIIAVAAVLAASDCQLSRETMEIKLDVISLCGSLENEDIFSCYKLMKEIEMGKCKTPKTSIFPNLSSGSTGVLENSSVTSAVGTKRRLTFNDSDQNCPLKETRRQ